LYTTDNMQYARVQQLYDHSEKTELTVRLQYRL